NGIIGRTSAVQSIIAVASQINLIAAGRQEIHELLGRFRVILNNENPAPPSYHNLASPNQYARAFDCIEYHKLEPGNYLLISQRQSELPKSSQFCCGSLQMLVESSWSCACRRG